MLAGIGISHSDVPALLARLSTHSVCNQERIYDVLCGCRQIDLATATYCQFSFNHSYFAYPKTKSMLYQKYLNGKQLSTGKSVWELYERSEFDAIESRTLEEVKDSLSIYKSMFDLKKQTDRSLKRLKKLEKNSPSSVANANSRNKP